MIEEPPRPYRRDWNYSGREILKQPLFYVLFLILMVAVTTGR